MKIIKLSDKSYQINLIPALCGELPMAAVWTSLFAMGLILCVALSSLHLIIPAPPNACIGVIVMSRTMRRQEKKISRKMPV